MKIIHKLASRGKNNKNRGKEKLHRSTPDKLEAANEMDSFKVAKAGRVLLQRRRIELSSGGGYHVKEAERCMCFCGYHCVSIDSVHGGIGVFL